MLDRLRAGFDALDAGQTTPIELDEMIEHYRRSARELEKFCGASGSAWEHAARALVAFDEEGDAVDWWERGAQP